MSDMSESSRDKFVRLAESRVNSAIKAIRLLGNLSNRSNYSYNDDDIEQIFSTLNSELRMSRQRFKRIQSESVSKFSLEK